MQQQTLRFEFQTHYTFASYYAGGNQELVAQLQSFAQNNDEQQIYLWGESGSGKTHLLQACCQSAKTYGKDPFYLALNPELTLEPDILNGLEHMDLVCLDNLQYIAENSEWQHALFNFYNNHRQNNHQLLIAADCPPKYLPFLLLDLKTRMAWGLTMKIQNLNEPELIAALRHKAQTLGFDLPLKVGRFLLRHYVHDLPSLWRLLDRIDHATLTAQRKLTIPFLKHILATEVETVADSKE